MDEKYYDALLHIKTSGGQKGFSPSVHYHRYEPTPYQGLEQLCKQYQLTSNDRVVDFGCGKGRLLFYLHHLFGATVVGVEVDKSLYQEAVQNKTRYLKYTKGRADQINLYNCVAEEYKIHPLDNKFYFFNPFSIQIFKNIVSNILHSHESSPREIKLIVYYGSNEYTYFLENHTPFERKEEISIIGLSESNPYERFIIYRLGY